MSILIPVLVPLLFTAQAAKPAAAPVDSITARNAYSKCVRDLIKPALAEKLPDADFYTRAGTTCAAQKTAFHDAVIAEDKADGLSAADAKSDADSQVQDYEDKLNASYSDYRSTNTEPA